MQHFEVGVAAWCNFAFCSSLRSSSYYMIGHLQACGLLSWLVYTVETALFAVFGRDSATEYAEHQRRVGCGSSGDHRNRNADFGRKDTTMT
jgi:hypothetical protein